MDMFIASTFHYLFQIIVQEGRLWADENEIAPFLGTEPSALGETVCNHPERLSFPVNYINDDVQIPIIPFIRSMTSASMRSVERIIEEMMKATAQDHGILTNG